MANIVVVTTANTYQVTFNDLASVVDMLEGTWQKLDAHAVLKSDHVEMIIKRERDWNLSYDGSNGMKIDTVDGAVPSSNKDLYDKLKAAL